MSEFKEQIEELFKTEDDKETYTVDEYLNFSPVQAFLNVRGDIWSIRRFEEWHSVIVGQSVKNATEYLQTTVKMMEKSNKKNCIDSDKCLDEEVNNKIDKSLEEYKLKKQQDNDQIVMSSGYL